jgi:hypothetical protein
MKFEESSGHFMSSQINNLPLGKTPGEEDRTLGRGDTFDGRSTPLGILQAISPKVDNSREFFL